MSCPARFATPRATVERDDKARQHGRTRRRVSRLTSLPIRFDRDRHRKPMTDLGAAPPPCGERVPQGVFFEDDSSGRRTAPEHGGRAEKMP